MPKKQTVKIIVIPVHGNTVKPFYVRKKLDTLAELFPEPEAKSETNNDDQEN